MSDELTGDDVLARATRALREQAAADGAAAGGAPGPWLAMDGWSGVVRELRRSGRRRRWLVAGGLQLAVALAGLGAWAAASGRLPALLFNRRPAGGESAPATRAPRHGARHAQAAPPVEQAPPEAPAPVEQPPPVEPAAPVEQAPPPPAPRRPRAAPVPVSASASARASVPMVESSPADALYQEAHRAHFVRRDYAAALAAWDRYLATGAVTFRPEARYNRAIALVRLGRREEAAAALLPFATGEYGGYRADDARALLKMLTAPP